MSRSPKELVPELQELYARFCEEMDKAQQHFILTCTRRTPEEQQALWNQGRSIPGKIVTWTLKSKHVEGKAFDIAMVIKVSQLDWSQEAYEKPGEIGESIGLEWGGHWQKPDRPHFQLREA